jgi:hypothetical protein
MSGDKVATHQKFESENSGLVNVTRRGEIQKEKVPKYDWGILICKKSQVRRAQPMKVIVPIHPLVCDMS